MGVTFRLLTQGSDQPTEPAADAASPGFGYGSGWLVTSLSARCPTRMPIKTESVVSKNAGLLAKHAKLIG